MEALFRIFKTWCPWELLYADDLVISVESIEEFRVEILGLEISSRKPWFDCQHAENKDYALQIPW